MHNPLTVATAAIAAALHTRLPGLGLLADATPPAKSGPGGASPRTSPSGFCWDCLHPDPASVPKGQSIYALLNGLYFLAIGCIVAAAVCGVIGWTGGSIVNIHVSQHGKTMLFRAAGGAIVIGLISAAIPFFMDL